MRRRLAAVAAGVLAAFYWGPHEGIAAQQPDLAALTREGSALMAEGQLEMALQRFRQASALRPDDPALEFNVGLTLFRMGRFAESLAPLERALAHPPSVPNARFLRGIIRFQSNEFGPAAEELEFVRSHAQFGEQSLYMLTESYRNSGDVEPAKQAFLELGARYPGSAFHHRLMGAAYDAEGMTEQALDEFRAAHRKTPAMPEVAFAIGFMLFKQRDFGQAAGWFRKELAVQPCHGKSHSYLGEIELAAKQPVSAEQHFRRAIGCDSTSSDSHRGLGAALEELDRYEEAATALRQATALDPSNSKAHYRLSRVLLRLGLHEEAAAASAAVSRLHASKHETAKQAIGAIDSGNQGE